MQKCRLPTGLTPASADNVCLHTITMQTMGSDTIGSKFADDLYLHMQHEDAENIGYVIPTPVIEHFINDYERNGQYTAFPALCIEWQKMESPFMRKALGMQVHTASLAHISNARDTYWVGPTWADY